MAAEPSSVWVPVTLGGRHVRLEPLAQSHFDALSATSNNPAIFRYYPIDYAGLAGMKAFFADALSSQDKGTALPFAVIALPGGQAIGSTRYGNIVREHRRAEIGWTWLAPRHQRSGINTEMKYLMLRHAFETLGLMRIEFKTDSLNEKSRAALLRIGATEEGTFRNHMIMPGGRIRHSVYYSVTSDDWPRVKRHLEGLMDRGARAA